VVDLLREKGDPRADWFDHHLRQYLAGEGDPPSGLAPEQITAARNGASMAAFFETSIDSIGASQNAAGGPGLLRMAFTAAGSMAKFLGSGYKGVSRASYRKRLETCASCEHHTGVRCRLCGCFTNVKAWMPHEECPGGKWPLQTDTGSESHSTHQRDS
jgi:hypothetical protein